MPIVVTNDVTSSQLASTFSDHLVFDLKFASQTAYWRIELFDERNQSLGAFSGMTTNGTIQGAWDLTDGQGNQLASSHVRTDFYTSPTGGSPMGGTNMKARRWFIKEIPGGIGNTFVVAWGWDAYWPSFNNNRITLMLNGVINILAFPDDEYFLRPAGNSYDGFTSQQSRFASQQNYFVSKRSDFTSQQCRFTSKQNHFASKQKCFTCQRNHFTSKQCHFASKKSVWPSCETGKSCQFDPASYAETLQSFPENLDFRPFFRDLGQVGPAGDALALFGLRRR